MNIGRLQLPEMKIVSSNIMPYGIADTVQRVTKLQSTVPAKECGQSHITSRSFEMSKNVG